MTLKIHLNNHIMYMIKYYKFAKLAYKYISSKYYLLIPKGFTNTILFIYIQIHTHVYMYTNY